MRGTRSRQTSWLGYLARLGFTDARRAAVALERPEMAGLVVVPGDDSGLVRALSLTADPDEGLNALGRVLEAAGAAAAGGSGAAAAGGATDSGAGSADSVDLAGLRAVLDHHDRERDHLLSVLGGSRALGDHLVSHPGHWPAAARPAQATAETRLARLLEEVRAADTHADRLDALRVGYREQILSIAAFDLMADEPTAVMPQVSRALADLAGAALETALWIVQAEHPDAAAKARLTVVAMGKCGGGELNYVSDVDVIFVAEPAEGVSEEEGLAAAGKLATALMKACSTGTREGTLWPVDAALRPEGKQGPLVRTVASHLQYYQRWAKTWEFQALLKARIVAGDREVGRAYLEAVSPLVWEAAGRENFVQDVQAMRRRVESHLPSAEADRQLKLGPGGLRDVEFSVQLLQLVHGRADETLRSGTTLEALQALARGGYVGRDDASDLDTAYRFLRSLEHRVQLYRMRRTHLMPTGQADLRRLGRSMGLRGEPAGVIELWKAQAREVRRIHERLFYRPLLSATARLNTDEARLTPEAARERLAALGFRDPAGAIRHLEALTVGYTRTAAIQRTLLPVMLGWFADEAAPDAGLLAFRQVSESLGGTHWYMQMLRDEGRAAERLAHVLGRSRYAADLLQRAPESVRILGADEGLAPRGKEDVLRTMRSALRRKDDPAEGMQAARVIRRGELFRIVLADLVGVVDHRRVGVALTDLTEALIQSALDQAITIVTRQRGSAPPTDVAVIGMGRLGGQECGYSSDADVVYLHRPHPGADDDDAASAALAVVQEMSRLLEAAGPDPQLQLDATLRPDGKSGPLVRTLDGYRAYYERWSRVWEAQALVRARPVAGDPDLGLAFVELIDPIRWPEQGLDPAAVKEIRRLKARMESERLPRGADPKTHVKLGPGGLSDVEWTIQLIQMVNAHRVPGLRTTQTLEAMEAAQAAGLLSAGDAANLRAAWDLASKLRNAIILWRGRASDSLPKDLQDAEGVARIIGGEPGSGATLVEQYLRTARHARVITERLFFGRGQP